MAELISRGEDANKALLKKKDCGGQSQLNRIKNKHVAILWA